MPVPPPVQGKILSILFGLEGLFDYVYVYLITLLGKPDAKSPESGVKLTVMAHKAIGDPGAFIIDGVLTYYIRV